MIRLNFRHLALPILLSACTPTVQTVYLPQALSRPERPVLPRVQPAQLECLSSLAYTVLYDRQRLITDYAITLETIIDSTKPADKTGQPHLGQPEQN